MPAFTAKDVAELRKQTGCGMMDCKNALVAADGDFDAAVKVLREKGMAATAKKQSRIAAEGLVDILTVGNKTAMIEVNTETDFVAKNASFKEFVQGLLRTILATEPADVDALKACKFDGTDETVEQVVSRDFFLTCAVAENLGVRASDLGIVRVIACVREQFLIDKLVDHLRHRVDPVEPTVIFLFGDAAQEELPCLIRQSEVTARKLMGCPCADFFL